MREKYVKGYFALSRLLVNDFLLFNVFFFLKFNKKVQSLGVPDFGVLGPETWVLSPRSLFLGPGSQVLSPESRVLTLDYAVIESVFSEIYKWLFR